MNWSPQQQAMLSAMGYSLYRQAGAPVPAAEPGAAAEAARAPASQATRADRLLQALARAAGGHDLAAVALPPLDQLRASGAAKRALWPTLRALRRQH